MTTNPTPEAATASDAHIWAPTTATLAVWKCKRCGFVGFAPHSLPPRGCIPEDGEQG